MNTELRWGILGTGFAAVQFAEGLRHAPGNRVAAVASRSGARGDRFALRFSVEKRFQRCEDLVRDTSIDVVYVATPTPLHRDHCIISLEAGKAVLCEKPFTLDSAQAKEVVATARKHRRFCMEAIRPRFLPAVHELHKLVRDGAIGTLQSFQAAIGHRVAYVPSSRFFDPAAGGGVLLDLGAYPLSLAVMLLGQPETISSRSILAPSGVDEEFSAILTYRGKRMATVTATFRSDLTANSVVTGSHGVIEMNAPLYWAQRLSLFPARANPWASADPLTTPAPEGLVAWIKERRFVREQMLRVKLAVDPLRKSKSTLILKPYRGNGFTDEAAEVTDCLRRGQLESPLSPLEHTIGVMEIMDEIRRQQPRLPENET